MRRWHKLLLWSIVSLEALACAQAQQGEVGAPTEQPYFFRIRQGRLDHEVCAIVRDDGFFHMEQETSDRVEIAQGSLSGEEIAALKTILSNSQLSALTQKDVPVALIPVPAVISEPEILQITVLRSSFTQNVEFPDRESRRPFDVLIDPLLHWTDLLQKHRRIKLNEDSGRTNCLPPRKLQFSPRPGPEQAADGAQPKAQQLESFVSPTGPSVPPPAPFLLRWQFNHTRRVTPQGTVEDTCIVIYPSGRFRLEKSTQGSPADFKIKAFENSLNEGELKQLQPLLNDPVLKASTHQNFPSARFSREGEVTAVAIYRDGRIQELGFANYFGFDTRHGAPSIDEDERIVKPLRKWLKNHIEARKLDSIPNASATRCAATNEGMR